MTQKGSDHGAGLRDTIQNLIVSSVRLSTGLTLYGIGQLQEIFDAAIGDKGLPGAAEKLESALQELSKSLESHMDESGIETLRSVSRVTAKVVERAFEAFCPEAIREAGKGLFGRRDDTTTHATPASVTLAVEVLSGTFVD
jgi:hypothetical protein